MSVPLMTPPAIVLISGKFGVGKSMLAHEIALRPDTKRLSFATPLKDVCSYLYGDYPLEKEARYENGRTGRQILQEVGGALRDYDADIFARIARDHAFGCGREVVVFDDWRYPNEATIFTKFAIRPTFVRINMPPDVYVKHIDQLGFKAADLSHHSEYSLDDWRFDYVLENNGTDLDWMRSFLDFLDQTWYNKYSKAVEVN